MLCRSILIVRSVFYSVVFLNYLYNVNIWVHERGIHGIQYHGKVISKDVKLLFVSAVSTKYFYKSFSSI